MRDATPLLSLELLERVATYDAIARELGVDRETARRAVREAVEAVVSDREEPPSEAVRGRIVDYLLREQTFPDRIQTRQLLDRSPADRAWAREARLSLGFVMQTPMPLIPDPDADVEGPATGPGTPRGVTAAPPSLTLAGAHAGRQGAVTSRRVYLIRRAVALAVLAAVVGAGVVAVVLVTSSGTTRHPRLRANLQHLTLSPSAIQPHATGLAAVVEQDNKLLLLLQGRHLVPNHHDFYAVWLFNSEADAELLGLVTPPVGSARTFSSGATLPDDAVRFHRLVVTSEATASPSRPGPQILSSPLSVQ